MFKLAYIKLTAVYVLIVLFISIIFSVVIYRTSYNEIDRGLGRQTRVFQGVQGDSMMPLSITFQGALRDVEMSRAAQLADSDNRIKIQLLYLNLIILLLSTAISYLLARLTLKPIEEMVEAQNRFTADASHELRTPLTAMRTEIEVLLRDKKVNLKEAEALLRSNLEEVGKLETLAGALLKLAKYQDGRREELNELSINDVIIEAYKKIESLAALKSINFENTVEDIKILGDSTSLVELFVILFDNAIKYSQKNTNVTVNSKKDLKHIEIIVSDHGIGITESDLPHIFSRFYRADHSRSKIFAGGYGLGLSIAKQIADVNNATIWATSKIGRGSQFHIKFPKS